MNRFLHGIVKVGPSPHLPVHCVTAAGARLMGSPRLRARAATLGLLPCVFFSASMAANPQVAADASGRQALELFNAKQYAAAKDRATAGAASGSVVSMYVLGEIYSSGQGAAQDYAEAASWFQKAADAGYPPAMNAMGSASETGRGVEQNLALAAGWYRRSAEQGDGAGMDHLGHMFEIGGGVPKDYAQAFQWYLKGAEAGAPAAMVHAGLMYENGRAATQAGQPALPDFGEALKWYEKAAKAGDAGGMYRLALSYETGKGIATDRSLAREWYRKAADAGSEEARTRLGNLTSGSQTAVGNPLPAPAGRGATGPDGAYRAGNGVSQPTLISKVEPEYSEAARKLRAEGVVVLQIVVPPDGAPQNLRVMRSLNYGLDEKAIEAVRQWRFNPGMKDGNAVAVAATVEVNFRLLRTGPPNYWYSGPVAFAPQAGVILPLVEDGTMPKAVPEILDESAVLEFTVDPSGSVKNIRAVHGSEAASELLTRNLAAWIFRPAMKDNRPVEATGRVRFVKGKGDDDSKLPLSPPLLRGSRSESNPAPSTAGAILTPLDPAAVDGKYVSTNSPTAALIDFVNRSGRAVDIYWINYQGRRQLLTAGLAAGATFSEGTYLTHPWLVVVSGTGGTTARDTGFRLAGFEAVTPNATRDRAKRDIAIIIGPVSAEALGAQVAACVAPPSGMVGWWPGDGNGNDIVGGHNPSSVNAVGFVPGEVGNGFRFGTQGYIEIPRSPGLENQRLTWLAWVRPDGPGPNANSLIVNQNIDGGHASVMLGWRPSDQRFIFVSGSARTELIASTDSFPAGVFYFIAGTYDGGIFKLFVNGILEGSLAESKTVPYSAYGWEIGSGTLRGFPNSPDTWNGVIDEVQAYNRALSATEILSIFQAGSAGVCKGAAANVADGRSVTPAPGPSNAASSAPVGAGQIRTMVNKKDGQVYVWIPPGAFTMGCSEGDNECDGNEKPPHIERIENGFWLGQTEVTQAAYQAVTGGNPSTRKGDQLPVETVTWDDALKYCSTIGGNLPSEIEWEYAALAGTMGARYGSLDAVAWHSGNSGDASSQPVGQKQPNAFGLYDMLGNVWEWMEDSYEDTPSKILRGGSSVAAAFNARASRRVVVEPSASSPNRGFRCGGQWPEPEKTPVSAGEAGPDGAYRGNGNGVSQPKLLRHFEPEYSEPARKAKLEGIVVLQIGIDAKGNVVDPRVIKSLGLGLDEKAIEAVRKWKFAPGYKDGKPFAVRAVTVEVNFRLL
jgi:TonB family protein